MTNIDYHDTTRDDISTSSDETLNHQQQQQQEEVDRAVGNAKPSSSLLYSVIGKAINTLISPRSGVNPKISNNGNLKNFKLSVLKSATRNFCDDGIIGQGGFGKVFKGWIDQNTLTATKPGSGIAIAVKRLCMRDHDQWSAVIKYSGHMYHPNLVRLFGYCSDNKKLLLVYEFMPQRSLHHHLFRGGSSSLLSWSLRMQIVREVAKTLAFLHGAKNVIYRRVTSKDILLDGDYSAKLSDFGLAIDGRTDDMSHDHMSLAGTIGYIAPECWKKGEVSAKCDVYGFGVVLLEILSGQRALDENRPGGEAFLATYAERRLREGNILSFIDQHLEGQYLLETAEKVADLAVRCVSEEAKLRPNMDEVVTILEQLEEQVNWAFR